jgi:hypothetical protein
MVVKIKPNEIVENKDVKSFYEKQDELINEIRECVKVREFRSPLVINRKNILMDGHVRRDVLLELGKGDEEIEVILVDEESSIDDYIIRNSGRIKTENDLVNEWKYIFFKKYQKRQGRKKNGDLEGTYAENVSRDLGGRFKDDETINKIGFCLKNDLPNNTISKGILKGTVSPESGFNYLSKWMKIDQDKNFGVNKMLVKGDLSVVEANNRIEELYNLTMEKRTEFIIPQKCYSFNMDCKKISDFEQFHKKVDLLFTSVPYYKQRFYENIDGEKQVGHEISVEDYCKNIVDLLEPSIMTLKESASVMINVAESFIGGVPQEVVFKLREEILKRTKLQWHHLINWEKKNYKGHGGADNKKRPKVNVEYILWFVVNRDKMIFNPIEIQNGRNPKIHKGFKNIDKNGNVKYSKSSISKGYDKIATHIREQYAEDVIITNSGENHDVKKIMKNSHPAIMNAALPIFPILWTTNEGPDNFVLDICAGTNVVSRMAHLLNRSSISFELSEKYFKVGCKMLENAIQDYNREDLDVINELAYGEVAEFELIEAA